MKKSIKLFIALFAVAIGVTSCLKDKPLFDAEEVNNIVEFGNIGVIESGTTSPYPLFSKAFEIVPEANLELHVNYAGDETAPEDITVSLAVNPEVLKVYNDSNRTSLTLLPANLYTLPNSVVIPKGQRIGNFVVKLKVSEFDFSKSYALPLAITSTSNNSNISGNFGKVVYKVGGKNKYDGVYTLKGRMTPAGDRPTFSSAAWTWPYEVSLITTGPNSVALHNTQYANDYTQPLVTTDGSVSRFGSFTPEFTFDPATGAITNIKNFIVNPANGRSAVINPAVTDSRYDASQKTVYAAFIMNQPNFAGLPIYDTLVFKKARP